MRMALTTAVEKVIPARSIPRGQSPMELLTPREMSRNNGNTTPDSNRSSDNPGP